MSPPFTLAGIARYPIVSILMASPLPLQAKAAATGNPLTHTIWEPHSANGQLRRCSSGMWRSENSRFNFSSEPLCAG